MQNYGEPDKIYVFDKNENLIAMFDKEDEQSIINPQIQKTQNAESVFTFSISPNNPKWIQINNPENLYQVDGKVYSTNFEGCFTEVINENNEDFIQVKAYEREKLLSRKFVRAWNSETGFEKIDTFMVVILSNGDLPLKNNGTTITTTYQKGTSGYALEGLLYGTGWTVGTCDVEGTFDLETDQVDVYENILKVQQIWGGILVFDSVNKVVHHRDETTWLPYNGYEVKYQKNMQSLEKLYNNKIITKLCPLGEGGLNIKSVNSNSEWITNYDYTDTELEGIENNPDIDDPTQLLAWGQRKLQQLCKPRKELTVKAVLLYQVEGYELERVDLNDIVDVINYANIDNDIEQLRVVGFTYKIWDYSDAVIELSDITLDSTDIFKKNVQATNSINAGTLNAKKVVNAQNGESINTTIQELEESSIAEVDVEYALGDDTTTAPTTGWSTTAPQWEQGKYMWQRTKVTYADGTIDISNPTCIAGAKGDPGSGGVGISSITEYYARSTSNSTAPADSDFVTSPIPTMTSTYKYLWNYELITYTDSSNEKTGKRVIGTYGDKGDTGDTGPAGKGISSILNYYQVSTSSSTPPSTWIPQTDPLPTMTSTNRYLWNYEVITYTDNTTYTSTAAVIGTYGDEGIGYQNITELYYLHTSNTNAPAAPTAHVTDNTGNAGVWTTKCPTWASGKYYWTCSELLKTDGTYSWTTPVNQSGLNTANSTANSANTKVDNLDIGGRNYALETSVSKVLTGANSNNQSMTLYDLSLTVAQINAVPSGKLICSFDMKLSGNLTGTSGTPSISVGQADSPWNRVVVTETVAGTYHKEIVLTNRAWTKNRVGMRCNYIDTGVTVTITNLKVEVANKYTDWSPAPEDMATMDNLTTEISNTGKRISLTATEASSGTSCGIEIRLKKDDGTDLDTQTANVTLSGKVAFTDLSTSGSTTINGDNITTGTIKSTNYVADTSGTSINLTNGVIDSKNFKVSSTGNVNATGGTIGGFTLGQNEFSANLTSEKMATYTYDSNDLERVRQILMGNISPTQQDYDKYDLTYSNEIDLVDYLFLGRIVAGTETGQAIFILDTKNSEKALSLKRTDGREVINLGLFGSYINQLSCGNIRSSGTIYSNSSIAINSRVNVNNNAILLINSYDNINNTETSDIFLEAHLTDNFLRGIALHSEDESIECYQKGTNVIGHKVLYNNTSGSNGTITLSESAANFDYIEVYAKLWNNSVVVFNKFKGTDTRFLLQGIITNYSSFMANMQIDYTVNGTTLTPMTPWTWTSESGASVDSTNNFKITKIIGYR